MTDKKNTNKEGSIRFRGAVASPGIALGKAFIYRRKNPEVQQSKISANEAEKHWQLFAEACNTLEQELNHLRQKKFSNEVIDIINAQIQIVNDPELRKKVKKLILDEHVPVDFAIQEAFESYLEVLSGSENNKMREHSVDISDIRNRLIQVVQNDYAITEIRAHHVLVAQEMSPREVIKLAGKDMKAIVMDQGGTTSHAAIIARSLGIPTVVGTQEVCSHISGGQCIAVDAEKGVVFVRPDEQEMTTLRTREKKYQRAVSNWQEVYQQASETKDGGSFSLRANLEFPEELPLVQQVQAEGIGLLRTESIYLGEDDFDDISRQQKMYEHILQETSEEPVTIRLFDAGGDKLFPTSPQEQNPFLGWRGIRLLLDEKELLCGQLEAILKTAGNYPGRIRLLVPMVTEPEELKTLKKYIADVSRKLQKQGHPVDRELQVGAMVEVPAVAVMMEHFIHEADFFSIGTNDLTQYVLAADRGNERVGKLYDQRHPAVWKLIHQVARAGQKFSKEVAVCGDLASDPVSAACLLGMGIRDLSMPPSRLGAVKSLLLNREHSEMKKLAGQTLKCQSAAEVTTLFNEWNQRK